MVCRGLLMTVLLWSGSVVAAERDWQRDIKPVLQARCVACHGPLKQQGGLRLDTAALARKGGENGAVIKSGDPAGSVLIQRISSADAEQRMPPEGDPLKPEQIALL